jgi:hypothetical protein
MIALDPKTITMIQGVGFSISESISFHGRCRDRSTTWWSPWCCDVCLVARSSGIRIHDATVKMQMMATDAHGEQVATTTTRHREAVVGL